MIVGTLIDLDAQARDAMEVIAAGWISHHDTDPGEPFVWHRFYGGQRVEVAA